MCGRSPRVHGHPLGHLRGGRGIGDRDVGEAKDQNPSGRGVKGVVHLVQEREELV